MYEPYTNLVNYCGLDNLSKAIIAEQWDECIKYIESGECCQPYRTNQIFRTIFNADFFCTPVSVHSISALYFALWKNASYDIIEALLGTIERKELKDQESAICTYDNGDQIKNNLTSPLYLAVQKCDLTTVKLLVENGFCFNLGNDKACACLSNSRHPDKLNILLYLIDNDLIYLNPINGHMSLYTEDDISKLRIGDKNLLAHAITSWSKELTLKLLTLGIPCKLYDSGEKKSLSPLLYALMEPNNYTVINALLQSSKTSDIKNLVCSISSQKGNSILFPDVMHPLALASKYQDSRVIELLISKGGNLDSVKSELFLILKPLIEVSKNIEIFKLFIEREVISIDEKFPILYTNDISFHPYIFNTLPYIIVFHGKLEFVKYFMSAEFDIFDNAEDLCYFFETLLTNVKLDVIEYTFVFFNVNFTNKIILDNSGNPFFFSLIYYLQKNRTDDFFKMTELFIRHGIDIHAKGKNNQNILHWCFDLLKSNFDTKRVLQFFIEKGVSTTDRDNRGNTLLHLLSQNSYNSNIETIDLLITEASKVMTRSEFVNSTNKWGKNALHYRFQDPASTRHLSEILYKLVSNGFYINTPDNDGETPLHYFVMHSKNPYSIDVLCSFGANINQENNNKKNALELLVNQSHYMSRDNNIIYYLKIFRIIANGGDYLKVDNNKKSFIDLTLFPCPYNNRPEMQPDFRFQKLKIFKLIIEHIRSHPNNKITKLFHGVLDHFCQPLEYVINTNEQKINKEARYHIHSEHIRSDLLPYVSSVFDQRAIEMTNSRKQSLAYSIWLSDLHSVKQNHLEYFLNKLEKILEYPESGIPIEKQDEAKTLLAQLASTKEGGPYLAGIKLLLLKGIEIDDTDQSIITFTKLLTNSEDADTKILHQYVRRLRGCEPYSLQTLSANYIYRKLHHNSRAQQINQLCCPPIILNMIKNIEKQDPGFP